MKKPAKRIWLMQHSDGTQGFHAYAPGEIEASERLLRPKKDKIVFLEYVLTSKRRIIERKAEEDGK